MKMAQYPIFDGSKPWEKKPQNRITSTKGIPQTKQKRTRDKNSTKAGMTAGATNEYYPRLSPIKQKFPDHNPQQASSQHDNYLEPKTRQKLEAESYKKEEKIIKANFEDFQKSVNDWTKTLRKTKTNDAMSRILEMERLLRQFKLDLHSMPQNDESKIHNPHPTSVASPHDRNDQTCHDRREGRGDQHIKENIDSLGPLYILSQEKIKSLEIENYQLRQLITDASHERPGASTNRRSEDFSVENELSQELDQSNNRIKELQQMILDSEDKLTAALSSSHGQDQRKKEQASSRDDEVRGRNQSRPSSFHLPEKVDKLINLYHWSRGRVYELESETVDSYASDSNVTQQRNLEKENELLYQKLNEYKQYNMQLKESVEELEREKEEALSRLSEIAERRLRENNATIEDQSTENRPTKISEKYKELYDNEWTDALDEMGNQNISDQDAITGLLEMLMEAYDFCTKQAERQYTQLTALETYFDRKEESFNEEVTLELSREAQELAKQFRKSASTTVVSLIQNAFMKKKRSTNMGPDTKKYCRKCVEITWYMSVQLPPMALDDMPSHGDVINLDRYAFYTKSGTVVDFVVWPACMIQKDGALLAKGVLQPEPSHSEKNKAKAEDKEKKKNDKNTHSHEANKPSKGQVTAL